MGAPDHPPHSGQGPPPHLQGQGPEPGQGQDSK